MMMINELLPLREKKLRLLQMIKTINLIISNLREATKEDMTNRSFNSVVRKVVDKYNQGKVNSFQRLFSHGFS